LAGAFIGKMRNRVESAAGAVSGPLTKGLAMLFPKRGLYT
jgi:hypothetical protein